jgi:hypothetical protein
MVTTKFHFCLCHSAAPVQTVLWKCVHAYTQFMREIWAIKAYLPGGSDGLYSASHFCPSTEGLLCLPEKKRHLHFDGED